MFTINNKILIIYHRFITNSKKNNLILINHKFNNNNTSLNPNSFINLKISSNMIIKHIIIKNNLFKLFTKNQLWQNNNNTIFVKWKLKTINKINIIIHLVIFKNSLCPIKRIWRLWNNYISLKVFNNILLNKKLIINNSNKKNKFCKINNRILLYLKITLNNFQMNLLNKSII